MIDPLDEAEREDFLVRYRRELAEAYPLQTDGAALLAVKRGLGAPAPATLGDWGSVAAVLRPCGQERGADVLAGQ